MKRQHPDSSDDDQEVRTWPPPAGRGGRATSEKWDARPRRDSSDSEPDDAAGRLLRVSALSDDADVARFEAWLRERGAWWRSESCRLARGAGIVGGGYGVVATAPIAKGDILFVTPREASFGAREHSRGGEHAKETEALDSQARLARVLLTERAKGEASEWFPKLATLSGAPVSWTWPADKRCWLDRTELEVPTQRKIERLHAELAAGTGAVCGDDRPGSAAAATAAAAPTPAQQVGFPRVECLSRSGRASRALRAFSPFLSPSPSPSGGVPRGVRRVHLPRQPVVWWVNGAWRKSAPDEGFSLVTRYQATA